MAESREELELALLRAQVRQIERQWLTSVGNVITGVITSVVASLIIATAVYVVGERWVASLLQRRDQVTAEIAQLAEKRERLVRERDSIAQAIATLSGVSTLYDQGIELTVGFRPSDNEFTTLVVASSPSPGVAIKAYDPCPGKYAFPGDAPVFGSKDCGELPGDRGRCTITESETECTFGPFMLKSDYDVGIWLVAAADGKRAVRYVSVSPVSGAH